LYLHTIRKTLRTAVIKVSKGKPSSGITLNGIPANPRYVVRGDSNVVLRGGSNYAFTVEHPLALLRMCGIHDASVEGVEEEWEFARPQHRAAYALMLRPSAVLGSPDGTISGGLMESVSREVIDSKAQRSELTVSESINITTEDGGKLEVHPAPEGTGLDIELYLATIGPVKARFDPEHGLKPDELRFRVGESVTSFIKGPVEQSLYHALGDIIGDLAGTGGIDDAYVKARFMRRYHYLTMSAVKKARLLPAD
jgi:hypothetical protein